jgi:alpha-L-fucosidase
MNDKQIKRMLMDASIHLKDAAKHWPKNPDSVNKWFEAASCLMEDVYPYLVYYDNRPLGGETEDNREGV